MRNHNENWTVPSALGKLHIELMNKLKKIKDIDLKKMFVAEINDRIRKLQFQNHTKINQSQGSNSAENKIKPRISDDIPHSGC